MTDKHKGVPQHFGRGRQVPKRHGIPSEFRPGGASGGCLETLKIGATVVTVVMMFGLRMAKVVRTTRVPGVRKAAVVRSGPCLMILGEFCTVVVGVVWLAMRAVRR